MGDLQIDKEFKNKPNPNWENSFNRFVEVIDSGTESSQLKAIKKLSHLSKHVPVDILISTVPILAKLLDVNGVVQEAAVYCLQSIARVDDSEDELATAIGESGVLQSVLMLLPQSRLGFREILVKCLWCLVSFDKNSRVVVAKNGGLQVVVDMLDSSTDRVRRYLLHILSALALLREVRRVIIRFGGLRYLVEAVKPDGRNMISRERACHAIGLIAINRRARRMLIELDVVPVLVELFRDGDSNTKLVVGNSLGVVSACADYVTLVSQAGAIPLYAKLLEGPDPIGKEIAEDSFCILAIVKANAIQIVEHLVRILRDGDNESKAAAADVLWDISGFKHSVSVIGNSGAFPILVGLLRESNDQVRESVSGAISQLSHDESNRIGLVDAGAVPVLIDLLGCESDELSDNVAEAIVNFSEDPLQRDRILEVIDAPVFENMQIRLAQIRASNEHVVRSMRRMSIDQLTENPDLV